MHANKWILAIGMVLAFTFVVCNAQTKPEKPDAPKSSEQKTEEKPDLPMCPVMNEPVNFFVSTMTPDGPVYFCCSDCIKKYTADPAKYAKGVAAQREALAKRPRIQVTCPLSGKAIDSKVSIDYKGQKIYFCCEGCPAGFQKDPDKYKAKLAASYTYQTRCPVTGEKIQPKAYVDLPTGERVYFSDWTCEKKFLAEPAKYAPALEAQGYSLDVKKLAESKQAKEKGSEDEHKHP